MKKLVSLVIMILIGFVADAQTQEAGLFGGGAYYVGDLNPQYHFLMTQPAFGALIKYNHGTRWSFRLSGFRGKVAGDDARSNVTETRGLRFESNITEISVAAEFNFFDFFIGSKKNIMSPYIFGGLGTFFYNPKVDDVALRSLGTEGQNAGFDGRKQYGNISIAIPFGLGFKYSFSRRLGFAVEWGLRKTLTDYIDDVSRTYYLEGSQIDPGNIEQYLSDPTQLHEPYMERGNPRTMDWYAFFGLAVTYQFDMFKGRGCPDQER
jgi:hypothetical protein